MLRLAAGGFEQLRLQLFLQEIVGLADVDQEGWKTSRRPRSVPPCRGPRQASLFGPEMAGRRLAPQGTSEGAMIGANALAAR